MPTTIQSDIEYYKSLILETALANGITQTEQISYILATAHHETAGFTSLTEVGSDQYLMQYASYAGNDPQTNDYITYRGHGFAQLTGKDNFSRIGDVLGYDLVGNPSLAAEPTIAAEILVIGMRDGLFTGYSLDRAINEHQVEYGYARQVINGYYNTQTGLFDKQNEISDLAIGYELYVDENTVGACTIDGYIRAEHTAFSEALLSEIDYGSNANQCSVTMETNGTSCNLTLTLPTAIHEPESDNDPSLIEQIQALVQSVLEALVPSTANAADLSLAYAGNMEDLTVTVDNGDGLALSETVSVQYGYVVLNDDEPPVETPATISLNNFQIDMDRFYEDGRDPRVSYTLSHDGDENLTGVKVKFYATKNGLLDGDEIYLDYESGGTLYVDEADNEGENLQALSDLTGDWIIITTVEHDGAEPVIVRTDEVSMTFGPQMQSVALENGSAVSDDNDLRIEYVLHNDGDENLYGVDVEFYASQSDVFDPSSAIYLDHETGGTLYADEQDTEGETIHAAADLSAGEWNLFSVATWDGQTDGVVLSTNQFTVSEEVARDIDLSLDNITFETDRLITSEQTELRVDFVIENSGSDSTADMSERTGIFWSADSVFDPNEDVMIDYDTHGTLYAGERDAEYERMDVSDIPNGQGYLFLVADPYNDIAETNEFNNVSDPYMVWVV